jgi:hypothetical protein
MYAVGQKVTLTVKRRNKPAVTVRGSVLAVLDGGIGYQIQWENVAGQYSTSLVGASERGLRAVG